MAHPEQEIFCLQVKMKFPSWPNPSPFHGANVLDCGSLDINGNNRFLFSRDCDYMGIDVGAGPNVNVVSKIHEFWGADEDYDTIICTECFEHDPYWRESLAAIVRMLKPGGLFIFTCATGYRPRHGTRDASPESSPLTLKLPEMADHYRNLSEADVRDAIDVPGIFSWYEFRVERDNRDLYFWGVRHGE